LTANKLEFYPDLNTEISLDLNLKLEPQTQAMGRIRRLSYLQQARDVFLEGSRFRSPVDAVASGERSIDEWCNCLNRVRVMYGMTVEPVPPEAIDFVIPHLEPAPSARI
jgi:hypothetical protein